MGQLIEVKCTECTYSEKFMCGAGLADCNLKDVATRFKEEVANHILYIDQNFNVDKYRYEKKIAFCNNCQSIHNIPVISVEYNKASRFNYGLSCSECGGDYIFIPIKEVCDLKCPQCKKGNLYNCGFGFWD